MFTENLPAALSTELKKINNIIVTGQYMDFIRNQRFRCTLLCHQEQKVDRSLKTTDIEDFYLQFTGQTDKPNLTFQELTLGQEVSFFNQSLTLKVRNTLSQAAMLTLYQNRFKPMHYLELCQKVLTQFPSRRMEEIKHSINEDLNLMRCVLAGLVAISSVLPDFTLEITDKPVACGLVRHQSLKQTFATNRRHQPITLDPFTRILLPYLDGTHTNEELLKIFRQQLAEDKLKVLDEQQKVITDPAEIDRRLPIIYNNAMQNMANQALLIFPALDKPAKKS